MKTDRESVAAMAERLKADFFIYKYGDDAASMLLALRDELDEAERLVEVERGNALDNYNRWAEAIAKSKAQNAMPDGWRDILSDISGFDPRGGR